MDIFFEFRSRIRSALEELVSKGLLLGEESFESIVVEPPRDHSLGDLATNAALILAKSEKKRPMVIAQLIADILAKDSSVGSVEIVKPGFINVILKSDIWFQVLAKAFSNPTTFGCNIHGKGKKINVEYVSANPTGPLHVGHTRGAVFGDALSNLLEFNGYEVTREYYVNDAGGQIDALARSVFLRYIELHGHKIELCEESYPGEYLIPVAAELKRKYGDQFVKEKESEWLGTFKSFSSDAMLNLIKEDLKLLGISMDKFYSEQALYKSGRINLALKSLAEKGLIYSGVLPPPKGKQVEDYEPKKQTLFKSTDFGDDLDRPLKKSDGSWTYFAPDVAYHFDKIERGYDELIDVFGADHSGYVKRMKAAVSALSAGKVNLHIKLCQLVRLYKKGRPYKMSKRAGNFVSVRDMISEVGRDVIRFMMLTRKNDAQLDFDVDKALEQSKDNAVFYVQYAHARCCSIIDKARRIGFNIDETKLEGAELAILTAKSEGRIIKKIAEWPRVVQVSGLSHEPHRIVFYLYELAAEIHSYQHEGKLNADLKVISQDANMMLARLVLIRTAQSVISVGLNILGVSPLTKM